MPCKCTSWAEMILPTSPSLRITSSDEPETVGDRLVRVVRTWLQHEALRKDARELVRIFPRVDVGRRGHAPVGRKGTARVPDLSAHCHSKRRDGLPLANGPCVKRVSPAGQESPRENRRTRYHMSVKRLHFVSCRRHRLKKLHDLLRTRDAVACRHEGQLQVDTAWQRGWAHRSTRLLLRKSTWPAIGSDDHCCRNWRSCGRRRSAHGGSDLLSHRSGSQSVYEVFGGFVRLWH